MIVEESFLKKIRQFGLNSYEAKIWTALLSRGVSTAGELADISNVPRSRSYDVLDTLERKGFIITKIGKPIKYLAIAPEEVIERVKKKIVLETEEKKKLFDELKTTEYLKELTAIYSAGVERIDPNEHNGIFVGKKRVYEEIASLVKRAKNTVEIMTSSTEAPDLMLEIYSTLKSLKEKNVSVKIALPKGKEILDKKFHDLAEIKNSYPVENRMVIVDQNEAIMMLFHNDEVHRDYDTGIWIKSGFLGKNLSQMFNSIWNTK